MERQDYIDQINDLKASNRRLIDFPIENSRVTDTLCVDPRPNQ